MRDQNEHKYLEWVIGGISAFMAMVFAWVNKKIDRKLSVNVFEEFRIGNDAQHKTTHNALAKIDTKLDKKQDK